MSWYPFAAGACLSIALRLIEPDLKTGAHVAAVGLIGLAILLVTER